MAIDSIGFGLIIPVLPSLLKELINADAAQAASYGGYLFFTYAAMNFLFGPLLGSLSDRFGRRPVLLASLATLGIDYLLMGFANSIWLLFVGRMLSGISGATISTAKAYIADITEPDKRAQAFGLVGAAFGIGFIMGPALGGQLGEIDARAPFFAAAILAFVNVAYGFLVLPESLDSKNRREFAIQRANPLGSFRQFGKLPTVRLLLGAVLLFNFAHVVYSATWSFHGDARYGWNSAQIGWSLVAVGAGFTIVQAGVIRIVLRHLGAARTAVFGVLCNAIAFVGFAFATEAWMVYAWIPVSALGAVGGPAINSLMSARVPSNAQGELQGGISSVQALANMFSPLVMTQVFSYFVGGEGFMLFYGAAFVLAAGLTLLSLFPLSLGIRSGRTTSESAQAHR